MNKTERNNILFLARWYPNKTDSMFGLFVKRHAESLVRSGKNVTVVYAQAIENQKEKFLVEENIEDGIDTIRIYFRHTKCRFFSILRFFRAIFKGLKVASRPDFIHVHVLTRLGVIALIYKALHHIPYGITEHWSRYLPENDFGGFWRKKITSVVVKKAEFVTAVTENLASAMKAYDLRNDHFVILPNVVNTELFDIKKHKNEVPTFVNVSCFENRSKNLTGLLDALNLLRRKGKIFRCIFVGDGEDFEMIRNHCKALNLDDFVEFTGLLEGDILAQKIASCDFLVVSSNYENLPVVIPEALSCGLPIVATDVGGISEIVDEQRGILVPSHSTESLAQGIEKMLENYQSYDKEVLRQSVVEKNSFLAVGKFLSQLYQEEK